MLFRRLITLSISIASHLLFYLLYAFFISLHTDSCAVAQLFTTSTSVESVTKPKCKFVDFLKFRCQGFLGSDLKPQYTPPPPLPPPIQSPDNTRNVNEYSSPTTFNFSAFIIALIASIIISLSGAFACWCGRTFINYRANQRLTAASRSSSTHVNHQNENITTDTLLESGTIEEPIESRIQSVRFVRTDSLPIYTTVATNNNNNVDKDDGPTTSEEPPPSYVSLFGGMSNKNQSR